MSTDLKTKKIVISMLTESTGSHFLDSGGAYGRHWERNKRFGNSVKAWDSRPDYVLNVWKADDFYHTVDLYHHLVNHLEFDSKLDAKFRRFDKKINLNKESYDQTTWEESLELFRKANPDIKFTRGDYTYNQENSLSQDIIYTPYDDGMNEGVVLMIHNGCDARGGFTSPRFFQITDESFWSFDGMPALFCKNGHRWFFEYPNHWINDDGLPELKDYESVNYDDLSENQQIEFDSSGRLIESPEIIYATNGQMTIAECGEIRLNRPAVYSKTLVCKDRELYCPECGEKLEI